MIDLVILSPERTLVHEQVHNVTLPSVQGPFQVLHGHAPIVAALEKGVVSYLGNDGLQAVEISSGFAKVENDTVTGCTE